MNKKEELRQQLLDKTLGKNRRVTSISNDLEDIIAYQKKTIEELKATTLEKDIERINKEIEKDFGVQFVDQKQTSFTSLSLEDIEKELQEKWHYDEMIHDLILMIQKGKLLEKKEFSCLIYNYHEIKGLLDDLAQMLHQNQYFTSSSISYVDFSHSSSKIDVFYQDMYNCLYSDSQIVLLDHIECLPIAFTQSIISLLDDKKIPLSNRYIEVQGVLKETNNQLVKGAISELKWQNKYILLLSHTSLNSLTNKYGTPFIKSIDSIKEFKKLTQEDQKRYIQEKIVNFRDRVQRQLKVDIHENLEDVLTYDTVCDVLERLFEELLDYSWNEDIVLSCKDQKIYLVKDHKEIELLKEDETHFEEIDQQLQELVGLDNVKEYLFSLRTYYQAIQKRKALGKKSADVNKHMIFCGNPGTGKTTIARILAQYLKASGILASGHLIEVTRKDLVGQYVGHTAQLTSQVISSALGGVLFIDEAYSLYRGQNDSFGLEAIDTLVKCMEDYRDNLVVILAGYRKEMDEFLTANSGLRSRFSNILEFNDYTGEQLYQISLSLAKKNDYLIDEKAKDELIRMLDEKNHQEGGNGRLARNLVEKAMIQHSLRNADDDLLILEDFKKGCD
ncbi:MAG: AAA family ATPase [Traorella sp.]